MKKTWNQPEITSLSIALTKTGNTTYWNETCLNDNNFKGEGDNLVVREPYSESDWLKCGKYGGEYYKPRDQGSQVTPPAPSAASAGS